MASPFYDIYLLNTKERIQGAISSFKITESTEKDNLLRFKVTFQNIREIPKDFLVESTEIEVRYGYRGGNQSPKKVFRVAGRKRSYTSLIEYNIVASDMGLLAKKAPRYETWKNLTASDIIEKICERNGFDRVIDSTSREYTVMPQEGRTDFEMMKYLATLQDGGLYRVYLQGNTVYFTNRDLDQSPEVTFDYTSIPNDIVFFKPKELEHTKSEASNSVSVRSINPDTGKLIDVEESNSEKKLARYDSSVSAKENVLDLNGRVVATTNVKPSSRQSINTDLNRKDVLIGVFPDESEMKAVAQNRASKKSLSTVSAVMQIVGNPLLSIDTLITLEGFEEADNGNWYIYEISHDLNSGYLSDLQLKRNATNTDTRLAGKDRNEDKDINKKAGDKDINTDKGIREDLYDANGRLVGTVTAG